MSDATFRTHPLVHGEAMLFERVCGPEAGGAERAGVAHQLVACLDVMLQVPLVLRLEVALVAHEPDTLAKGVSSLYC
jgi:hypothetical protein